MKDFSVEYNIFYEIYYYIYHDVVDGFGLDSGDLEYEKCLKTLLNVKPKK